jgi:hypothetical protein
MSKQGGATTLKGCTVNLSVEVEKFMFGGQFLRRWYGNAQLPICLAVQLIGADEASP